MSGRIDWDGKEFLCTGVSIKIDVENGVIQTEVEGEASTWGPDGVAGPYPIAPPYPDPPGDNPAVPWPDWPPGATPDNPDGDPPPWGEPDELHWPMTVYMPLWSGHVIRATDVGIGHMPAYVNLGQTPNVGNLLWMALDQFDLVDTAMVCAYSPNEVWKTTNLSADNPDWEKMFGPVLGLNGANIRWTMVQSSSMQPGLWMVAGYEPSAPASIYIRWTITGGDSWNSTNFTSIDAENGFVFLELSTHDANRAWVTWSDSNDGRTYIAVTSDMWATPPTQTFIPAACFTGGYDWYAPLHHRDFENDDDSEVIYGGGVFSGGPGADYARIYREATCTTLYSETTTRPDVVRVGCGDGTTRRWWALATNDDDIIGFWVLDAGAWVEQSTWGTVGGTLESRDCRNVVGEWQSYVAIRDGTPWVLIVSTNRGGSWSVQIGDWTLFLIAEGLGDPDVMCVCGANLLP